MAIGAITSSASLLMGTHAASSVVSPLTEGSARTTNKTARFVKGALFEGSKYTHAFTAGLLLSNVINFVAAPFTFLIIPVAIKAIRWVGEKISNKGGQYAPS